MSMTKRYLHLIEEQTKRTKHTYEWWEDEAHYSAQDDPFTGEYPSSLITGGKSQQQERTEAVNTSTNTALQGGTQ